MCAIIYSLNALQELDTVVMSYEGLARVQRLLFVAAHCPVLEVEALK